MKKQPETKKKPPIVMGKGTLVASIAVAFLLTGAYLLPVTTEQVPTPTQTEVTLPQAANDNTPTTNETPAVPDLSTLPSLEGLGKLSPHVFYFRGPLESLDPAELADFRNTVSGARAEGKRVLLIIDSPGGIVTLEEELSAVFEENPGTIDTMIEGMAASAAAQIWVLGDHRYMRGDSVLLYHSAQISELGLCQGELKGLLDFVNDKKFDNLLTTPLGGVPPTFTLGEAIKMDKINQLAGFPPMGADGVLVAAITIAKDIDQIRRRIHMEYLMAVQINEVGSQHVYDAIKADGGTMTLADVQHKLYGDFYYETPLSRKQVLSYKLTNETGLPSMDTYDKA